MHYVSEVLQEKWELFPVDRLPYIDQIAVKFCRFFLYSLGRILNVRLPSVRESLSKRVT